MDLNNSLNQLLGLIITGFIPLTIYLIRNQAKAQKIINDEFPKIRAELDQERKIRAANEKEAAKREGTLAERVRQAENKLKEAREHDRENLRKISGLQAVVGALRQQQRDLSNSLTQVLRERDDAAIRLHQKEVEAEEKDRTIAELREVITTTTDQLKEAVLARADLQMQIDELRKIIGAKTELAEKIESNLGENLNEEQQALPGFDVTADDRSDDADPVDSTGIDPGSVSNPS